MTPMRSGPLDSRSYNGTMDDDALTPQDLDELAEGLSRGPLNETLWPLPIEEFPGSPSDDAEIDSRTYPGRLGLTHIAFRLRLA